MAKEKPLSERLDAAIEKAAQRYPRSVILEAEAASKLRQLSIGTLGIYAEVRNHGTDLAGAGHLASAPARVAT